MSASLPIIDLNDLLDDQRKAKAIQALGASLEDLGFVAIRNHGISDSVIQAAYRAAEQVFRLPLSTKVAYEHPEEGRQRGYTATGVEHAKDQRAADLKEFWHVGREEEVDGRPVPRNHFPLEVPEFRRATHELFNSFEAFSSLLLSAIAIHLGHPSDWFVDKVRGGNSVLRIIHYPRLENPPEGAVRAAQHEDINLITILPASTQPGLELLTREGHWLPVVTPPDVMVCDTGDMMQRLTAGRMRATTHRVVNPPGADTSARYAMPFFVHPHADCVLAPHGQPGLTAARYLQERLKETGVA